MAVNRDINQHNGGLIVFEVREFILKDIFDFAKFRRFIIPSFQRDYAWGWEQCEKLWSNIYDEYESKDRNHYFLGTIITYKTDSSRNGQVPEVNIIDGQQRITTLLLLFRAIHHVLSNKIVNVDNTEMKNEMNQLLRDVASKICQPRIDDIGIERPNFNDPRLLRSARNHNSIAEIIADGRIIATDNNDNSITTDYTDDDHLNIFLNEKKKLNEKRRGRRRPLPEDLEKYLFSNEYTNYALFINKVKSLDMKIIGFTKFLFDNCILLNIMPPSEDYAFTVFDTLNNAGLQLEPSDIVKNYIFELAHQRDRTENTSRSWDELEAICAKNTNGKTLDLNDVFRNYMNITRVTSGQYGTKWALSKDPNIRDYFSKRQSEIFPNGYESLRDEQLMDTLVGLSRFLKSAINPGFETDDDTNELISIEAQQGIHIIQYLSNRNNLQYKYLLSLFWYMRRDDAKNNPQKFANDFAKYIKFCLSYLALTAIMSVEDSEDSDSITIGNGTIPRLCEMFAGREPSADRNQSDNRHIDLSKINDYITTVRHLLSKAEIDKNKKLDFLPLMYSYIAFENQSIIDNYSIEHIFPQQWKNTNLVKSYESEFDGIPESDRLNYLNDYVSILGNLMSMDEKINKSAQNCVLKEKIRRYKSHHDKLTLENREFINSNGKKDIWSLQDIRTRSETMINAIFDYIRSGISEGIGR